MMTDIAGGALTRPVAGQDGTAGQQPDRLRAAAQALEAGFLAEMLTAAGLGKTAGAFGGGEGEAHFSSFLVRAQAEEMVRAGGIGLTESLFAALAERRADV